MTISILAILLLIAKQIHSKRGGLKMLFKPPLYCYSQMDFPITKESATLAMSGLVPPLTLIPKSSLESSFKKVSESMSKSEPERCKLEIVIIAI
jgi:hypothetical protein